MADTPNLPTRAGLRMLLGVQDDYDTLGMAFLGAGETVLANCPPGEWRETALYQLVAALHAARASVVYNPGQVGE